MVCLEASNVGMVARECIFVDSVVVWFGVEMGVCDVS